MRVQRVVVPAAVLGWAWVALAQTPQAPQSQQPARDRPAQQQQQQATPAPSAVITGRVVTADNGRPVKRARVAVSARELPEGRATLTDDSGVYEITELPAGRYTLTVAKSGFISLSYGQRRPLQSGTPLQLGDGQQLKGVDFRLPRGGVIAGRIFDEDGEGLPGASVRVMRYQYLQGDRRLVPVGNSQTDDKGQYRVWGLMPGDYYVNVVARNFNIIGGRGGRGVIANAIGIVGGNVFVGDEDPTQVAYAPTYYPGVGSVNEARAVTLDVSQELTDVNFGIQLVRTARVTGFVSNGDGSPAYNGNVTISPDSGPAAGRGGPIGTNYGSRIDWDGTFTIVNVPPGRYTLRARSGGNDDPQYATQPVSVSSGDVSNVAVILAPGGTISGTVALQSATPADLTQVRVAAPSADQSSFGVNPQTRVDKNGTFALSGVPAGLHFIRSNGAPRGWSLRSVLIDGRESIDTPVDVRSGQTVAGVALIFTDKISEITGTITNAQGTPLTDFTILAFPTDQTQWRPQSRYIATTRPDQNGSFQLRGLPPGEYYIAPVDPAEQGEWFEPAFLDAHRQGAARLTLGDGDVKTQDFKLATR